MNLPTPEVTGFAGSDPVLRFEEQVGSVTVSLMFGVFASPDMFCGCQQRVHGWIYMAMEGISVDEIMSFVAAATANSGLIERNRDGEPWTER